MSVPELLAIPEPVWLVEDHISTQEVGVLYGKPNGGKSFVALDWALSVAAGVPWLGKYATKQGPVLYLAGEGGPSLQKRVEAWLDYHGLDDVPAHFHVRPIPLLDADEIAEIQDSLQHFCNADGEEVGLRPAFIVVDTLSQFIMGGDENGPDMALFVAHLRRLSQDQLATVLIVHHTNKGGEQERGHTALRGNVDVMFKVEGREDNQGRLVGITLSNDKQRDNPKSKPGNLSTIFHKRSLVLSLANTIKFPGFSMEISTDSLVNLLIAAGNIEEISTEIFQSEEWRIVSDLMPSTYARERHKLLRMKLVKSAGHGKYAFTPVGRETMHYYKKLRAKTG